MAVTPVILYNGRTVTIPNPPERIQCIPSPPRTVNTTLTGESETILAARFDNRVTAEWPLLDAAGTLRTQLLNAFQWVVRGNAAQLAVDSTKVVNTMTIGTAAAGATAVVVASATGIAAGTYRLISGPYEQLVVVSSVSGTTINFTTTPLDFAITSGIFRDQYFFPIQLRDPQAPLWVRDAVAAEMPSFPPARIHVGMDFYEDTSHVYAGLVGYWSLEEASGIRYDQLGLHDLTPVNAPANAAGKIANGALLASASSQYLTAAVVDGDVLQMVDTDVTIAGWFKFTTKATNMLIAGQINTGVVGGAAAWLQYITASDRLRFSIGNAAGSSATATANNLGAVATATWYFIVGWRDKAAGTINIQVNDGTADSTVTALIPTTITQPFRVGASADASQFFNGVADEVMVFKRVLTTAEKTALYNAGAGVAYSSTLAVFSS